VRDDARELVEPLVFAFDPALVRLPLRDVAAGGEEPVFALHVDATDLHLHRESRAVGTPERRLQPVRLAHLQALPDVDRLRRVHVRVDLPDVHLHDLLTVVASSAAITGFASTISPASSWMLIMSGESS